MTSLIPAQPGWRLLRYHPTDAGGPEAFPIIGWTTNPKADPNNDHPDLTPIYADPDLGALIHNTGNFLDDCFLIPPHIEWFTGRSNDGDTFTINVNAIDVYRNAYPG